MYDITKIKMVEDATKSASTTTNDIISNTAQKVNTADKEYFEELGSGRQGLVDIVNEAIKGKRILDFNRNKIREDLSVIAQRTRLSNITESSLDESLSRFRKEIKSFREKNNIQYESRTAELTDEQIIEQRLKHLKDTEIEETRRYENNTTLFGKEMMAIARNSGNKNNTDTATYLRCEDLDGDILITRDGFKHGADRSMDSLYVSVCKALPEVLQNSIVVNELKPRDNTTNGSYVLIGLAERDGNFVAVRSIVNKKTWKLEDYNELYAIKKEDVSLQAPALPQKEGYVTSSTISISNFLKIVNRSNLANVVLSEDAIKILTATAVMTKNNTIFNVDDGLLGMTEYINDHDRRILYNKKRDGDLAKRFQAYMPFALKQDSVSNNSVSDLLRIVNRSNLANVVLSFYSKQGINGKYDQKPHIVLTIAERSFFQEGGRAGYNEIIQSAIKEGRVLDYDVKKRDDLSVIAESAGLGNITKSSLEKSLSRFRKEIKSFREKNNIHFVKRTISNTNPELLS